MGHTLLVPLPGFGLPLNYKPTKDGDDHDYSQDKDILFPNALDPADLSTRRTALRLITLRELTMLRLMNHLTDKPNWHRKIFDEKIVAKLKSEALASERIEVTERMFDWCIQELRWKAPSFDPIVGTEVYDAGIIKSDSAIPSDLQYSLREAVKALEDVPDHLKDWHPGSNEQVLDLVHPSLFPLIYGRSKILPNSLVSLDDCIECSGQGVTIPIPPDSETEYASKTFGTRKQEGESTKPFSKHFQWLPCDVQIYNKFALITSYINNLHPTKHEDLYWIIARIITQTIPLWSMALTSVKDPDTNPIRINYTNCQYDPDPENLPTSEGPQQIDGEPVFKFWRRRREWVKATKKVVQPEPENFKPPTSHQRREREILKRGMPTKPQPEVDIFRDYVGQGIQVIVKLANIHLTPENPEYAGGSWHVEGQLNEHICASAVYYYDSENITTSRLSFRQQVNTNTRHIGYRQDDHDWLQPVFGCDPNGPSIQELGSAVTSEGRLLVWPNILQHRVEPFKLADPMKPGHRKILALFLVDPNIRVISTANVPCQRADWCMEAVRESDDTVFDLPTEGTDGFPISLKEAKELRLKLMDERRRYVVGMDQVFQRHEFSLCEH